MADSVNIIRRRIALMESRGPLAQTRTKDFAPTGHPSIDRVLGGGLMRGRLHELLAETGDEGSVSGLAAVLAQLLGGELLWLVQEAGAHAGTLNAVGLAEIGLDPARLIIAVLPDAAMVLRAAADGLRCPALGGVVIKLSGDPRSLDLTASRRLALAAEETGVTAVMLRLGGNPTPNAAQTRWRVAAAPSAPLAANAPGHPAWQMELLRQRGRPGGGRWRVEWSREQGRLYDGHEGEGTALPVAVVPLSFDRSAGAGMPLRRTG